MKSQNRYYRLVKHNDVHHREKTIVGFEPGQSYKCKVRAHNELGFSQWSELLENVTPRDGVHVKEFGDDWAQVAWFEPVVNAALKRHITGYELQMCVPTGPLRTEITVYDPLQHGIKNVQVLIYTMLELHNDS